jgi:hypothetical protein
MKMNTIQLRANQDFTPSPNFVLGAACRAETRRMRIDFGLWTLDITPTPTNFG